MGILWIGAAISISEIFTGGLLAPLGLAKGIAAIIIGHLIGTALLGFAGYISFVRKQNAMESVSHSFGSLGGRLIAFCNVVQLIGWTIVMVVQGLSVIRGVFPETPFMPAAAVLSGLVLIWALSVGSPVGRLNEIAVSLLAILCGVLFAEALGLFRANGGQAASPGGSMALGIELSIAMPVSWLPLIGDYSCKARSKAAAALLPFAGYFLGSVTMYLLGLFIGISGGGDIFTFMAGSRFKFVACGVVVLSTLTTAFLDLYSAAESSKHLTGARGSRSPILVIGIFAGLAAVFFPVERYEAMLEGFLVSIGMVFVPVYTVLCLDFLRRGSGQARSWVKLGICIAGMIVYRLCGAYGVGVPSLMSMAFVSLATVLSAL
jgi:putative hydroxymethylpyrimidine transporter CytX